ncbi:MAG: cytochrome c peroxidase [Byssovorax sp.]
MMQRILWSSLIPLALAAGCGAVPDGDEKAPGEPAIGESAQALSRKKEAKRLFEEETFGGNGRTCATCHSAETGTLSPADVEARYAADPNDPLFLHDGSDDFEGHGVSRILADATVLIRIPLPPNVTLANDPTATSVVVRRGIPTTLNTPALDPVLMYDGRAPDLEAQALGAIHDHAQSAVEPTEDQLAMIAEHQKTKDFFTSTAIRDFFLDGEVPALPEGTTASEKRGRAFFEDFPISSQLNQDSPRKGLCAICHSGPMLNESNGFNPLPVPPFHVPKGTRFQSVLVSELNHANNPLYDFLVHNPDGSTTLVQSPDPGISLINGNFVGFPFGQFSNFKIPPLWGIKRTAPYFHDSSRKTLEDVMDHYTTFFAIATDTNIDGDPPLVLTAQDRADVVAFLNLL